LLLRAFLFFCGLSLLTTAALLVGRGQPVRPVIAYSSGQPERDGASTMLADVERALSYRLPQQDVPHVLIDWLDSRHLLLYQPASTISHLIFTFGRGLQPLALPDDCRLDTLRGRGDYLSCAGLQGGGVLVFRWDGAGAVRRYLAGIATGNHVWSPDGSALAVSDVSPRGGGLLRLSLASGDVLRIVSTPLSGINTPVSWSPDGTHIAIMIHERNGYFAEVYGREGGAVRARVSLGNALPGFAASWSPDGEALALSYFDAFGSDIFTYSLRQAATHWLTDGKRTSMYPLWSSDGAWIAYYGMGETVGGVYLLPSSGGEIRPLVRLRLANFVYRWRPAD
jgi:hypothetical protein